MAWIYLIFGGFCEFGFTAFLKMSDNLTKPLPSTGFFILASVSYLFLYLGMKTLPMGTAYAVWTGLGAFGTVIIGLVFFKEPITFWRIFFLGMLITSVIGLKVTSK